MAGQIDGSAKSSIKQSIGPRSDDQQKIGQLFGKIDSANKIFRGQMWRLHTFTVIIIGGQASVAR